MFSISTHNLHSYSSYEQAQELFDKIKPVRGTNNRPLDYKRTSRTMYIRMEDEKFIFRMYNTDCVTYYKDGRVELSTDGWSSQSTCKFLDAMSPYRTFIKNSYLWVSIRNKFYALSGKRTMVDPDGIVTNSQQTFKYVADKAARAAVRKEYKTELEELASYARVLTPSAELYQDMYSRSLTDDKIKFARDCMVISRSNWNEAEVWKLDINAGRAKFLNNKYKGLPNSGFVTVPAPIGEMV